MNTESKGKKLRALINRKRKVLVVLDPPTAAHGRLMERAGCEVGFVGTGGVLGAYTGLADVGTLTMMECVQIGGWIAQAVNDPIILDGTRATEASWPYGVSFANAYAQASPEFASMTSRSKESAGPRARAWK